VSASIQDDLEILTEEDILKNLPDGGPSELGDHRFASGASAVLRARSVVIPAEFNFLLNPRHPAFGRIIVEPSIPFIFDARLFRK
jgi:hypothetical protein